VEGSWKKNSRSLAFIVPARVTVMAMYDPDESRRIFQFVNWHDAYVVYRRRITVSITLLYLAFARLIATCKRSLGSMFAEDPRSFLFSSAFSRSNSS